MSVSRSAPAEPKVEYPIPYYNPRVIDERFAVPGQSYKARFAGGRYVATTKADADAVEAALKAWGPDKPERWKGDDRKSEWTCKKCGFRTRNDNAKEDHEAYGLH